MPFFFAGLAAHVNDPNPWHGLVVGASRHFQKTVIAFLSIVISLHGRRGSSFHSLSTVFNSS